MTDLWPALGRWLNQCEGNTGTRAEVVVAVVDPTEGWLHTGILHCDGATPAILHLAFHARLKNDPLPSNQLRYLGVQLIAEEAKIAALCALCRRLYKRWMTSGLPYGVRIGAQIEFDGSYLLPPGTSGFTCATFVGRVVERSGMSLVLWDTWQPRKDDDSWFNWIVSMLEQCPHVPKSHVDRVKSEYQCARFRPEDVICAAQLFAKSGIGDLDFNTIAPLAMRLRDELVEDARASISS